MKLRETLAAKQWSQQTLAKKIGMSQGMVSIWIRGYMTPTIEQKKKIEAALGIPVDWQVDDDD
jgi:ribosome-binding protein aMBF1 (putative translation factor)